jgi:transcriptional antiterminator
MSKSITKRIFQMIYDSNGISRDEIKQVLQLSDKTLSNCLYSIKKKSDIKSDKGLYSIKKKSDIKTDKDDLKIEQKKQWSVPVIPDYSNIHFLVWPFITP